MNIKALEKKFGLEWDRKYPHQAAYLKKCEAYLWNGKKRDWIFIQARKRIYDGQLEKVKKSFSWFQKRKMKDLFWSVVMGKLAVCKDNKKSLDKISLLRVAVEIDAAVKNNKGVQP